MLLFMEKKTFTLVLEPEEANQDSDIVDKCYRARTSPEQNILPPQSVFVTVNRGKVCNYTGEHSYVKGRVLNLALLGI